MLFDLNDADEISSGKILLNLTDIIPELYPKIIDKLKLPFGFK
jgi:hypothetical protein